MMRKFGLISLALLTVVVWIPLVVNFALDSPSLRGWLSRQISSRLRARVKFGPVRWYGNFIQVLWADIEFPSVSMDTELEHTGDNMERSSGLVQTRTEGLLWWNC